MWYCGSGNKNNGMEIILKKEHADRLVELWKTTNRIICLKMELDGVKLNVISAYAPQVGYIREKKEAFWLDLDKTVEKIPKSKRTVVGADLNGHVGEGNNGDEECMSRNVLGKRNNEEQAVVDFAKRMVLTHGIQLEITRLRYSSKHDLNIYQFNYQVNTRSGGFLQKAHIRKARTAKRYESI